MNESVFITGIEGFVGSHLARYLFDNGYQVSGLRMAEPVADLSFARVHIGDVRDCAAVQALLASAAPDFIIHLAAISSVRIAEQDPGRAVQVNVLGTTQLLEAVRIAAPAARVLVVSSSDVYNSLAGKDGRFDEDAAVRPMNVYALTKLCAENVGRYYVDRHGLNVVILRPFSHTGPGQSTDFVFPSVARQIAQAEAGQRAPEIEVGNTDVSRDYTDIRDVCRAYRLALTGGVKGDIFNITSEQLLRIGDGIDYLVSLAKVPIAVRVGAGRVRREKTVLAGSSARFRAATGWQPEIDVRQTLRDVLEYERGRVNAAR